MKSIAILKGDTAVTGSVSFTQADEKSTVSIEIKVTGLTPGKYST